ncbi:MAG: COX15/CtaA family protein, partial [Legionellales bacterium]|nr:COX15/CtaA family protein [Legionellales bacterium]
TLKLLPVVVMAHLLGGLLIFGGLSYFRMQLSDVKVMPGVGWRFMTTLGLVLILCQIALGGWVSANYAGLACIGFPRCNGLWWPALDFSHGFHVFSPVGDNYQGGVLEHHVRMTIQWVHRVGALVVFLYVLGLSLLMLKCSKAKLIRRSAWLALFLVLVQCALGVANVVYLLPLWVALLHNGVAALLLATMLWMHHLGGSPHANQC